MSRLSWLSFNIQLRSEMKIYIPLIDSWRFTAISLQRILACGGLSYDYCYHCNKGGKTVEISDFHTSKQTREKKRTRPAKLLSNESTELCENDRHRIKNTASVSSSAVSSIVTFSDDLGPSARSLGGRREMCCRADSYRHPLDVLTHPTS